MTILNLLKKCTKTFSFGYCIIKFKNRKEEKFLLAHQGIIVYNKFGGLINSSAGIQPHCLSAEFAFRQTSHYCMWFCKQTA
ncbi:hypothetical protein HMPREF9353_01210 [Treponema denticola F0402]|nr:hypothetical protein HMPREF9353_01210 [Treponema denticola F0402]